VTESKRRAVIYAYAFTVTARLGDIALFAMLISALRVEDMATFALASAVSAIFAIGVVFGADQVLVRGFSEGSLPLGAAIRRVGGIWSYSSAASCVLLGLLLVYWGHLQSHALVIWIACTSQIVSLVTKFVQSLLRGKNNQTAANALLLAESAIRLVVISALCFMTRQLTSEAVFEGFLLCQVIVAGIAVRVAKRADLASWPPNGRFESGEIPLGGVIQSYGYFFGIALVSVIQNRLDWLMISEFSSPIELANYSIANRAFEIFLLLIGIAATTAYPWLCRTASGQRSDSLMLMKQIEVCMGVTLALACGPLASELISLLWPLKYIEAELYIVWLLPVGAVSAVVIVLYYEVVARALERKALVIGFGASIVHVVANWFLIQNFGAFGAVGGMALLSVVCLGSYAALIHRNQLWERRRLGQVLTYLVLMVAIWLISTRVNMSGWVHFVSLTVIGVSLGTLLLLDKCERHLLRESTLLR
jgi:O-antigen/teichoic acid export membrane protein